MVDMIDGTAIDSVSKGAVGENLASKMRCRIQARNFSLQYGCGIEDKMKHQINFMAHDATLLSANEIRSFKQLADHLSDLESTAKYQIKRPRIEVWFLLLTIYYLVDCCGYNWILICCMPC
jgi:hypothetical protein